MSGRELLQRCYLFFTSHATEAYNECLNGDTLSCCIQAMPDINMGRTAVIRTNKISISENDTWQFPQTAESSVARPAAAVWRGEQRAPSSAAEMDPMVTDMFILQPGCSSVEVSTWRSSGGRSAGDRCAQQARTQRTQGAASSRRHTPVQKRALICEERLRLCSP